MSQSWTRRKGFLLLFKERIGVVAGQLPIPEYPNGIEATAQISILIDGRLAHQDLIPWALPRSALMLAQQVYLLAMSTDYDGSPWKPFLVKFCAQCPNFRPPDRILYTKI
jgi:hypothetical protein